MNRKTAVIIGAGISGIALSVRLALKNFDVHVLEASDGPGGKLNIHKTDGYRYDLGPSLFTMPHLVTELFILAGKNPDDYLKYKTIDMACKYFWEDGTILEAWVSKNRFADEINRVLGVKKKNIMSYLKHQEGLYNAVAPLFLKKSLHKPASYFNPELLKAILYLPNMGLFTTMHEQNSKKLKNPRLVQLFNRMATYNGSSPYLAPGILNIISSLEHGSGVFFPEGGMYSITQSLVRLAEELGVKFHYSEKALKIIHYKTRIKSVQTEKNQYQADVVISNADIVPTYRNLLPDIQPPEKILKQERSSSALVYYWGIGREFKELELHNIIFSNDYREEFNNIFVKKEIFNDPTIYINISSKKNRSDAPEGHENWFLMVNAPHNNEQKWKEITLQAKDNILRKLSVILKTDVSKYILSEYILDPVGIESRTSSYKGSLYGTSSNSIFSAFFRHPNFSRQIKGLYFTGGSVHPGGGIPLCLLSAEIVSDLISEYH